MIFFFEIAGFDYKASSINLQAVRLCFQVSLKDPQTGMYSIVLDPVVSNPIHNSCLKITNLSHCNATCKGGEKIIILCKKVTFFEELKRFS